MTDNPNSTPLIIDDDGSQDGMTAIAYMLTDPNTNLLPIVSFSSDRTSIIEGGEAQLLTFDLSEPAPVGGLTVKLNIDDPDGEGADTEFPPELISNIVDFGQVEEDGTITASLTIAEGATEATFGISAIADNLDEGNETYSLTLLEDETYITDSNSTTITTTIEDNMTLPTVSITPEILIATEGETMRWNFSLDAPAPEGGLSLFLPITVNNDPAPGDVEYNIDGGENIAEFEFVTNNDLSVGFNLTIAEGATEAVLVSEAVADDVTETDESFTTVIADGVDYQADDEQNEVTTIITELPIVSLLTEEVTAAEGDTFIWDFSLNQAASEGGLTLFLPVTDNNDPAPGDVEYNIDGSENITDFEFVIEDDVSIGFNLTIAEGSTEASLVSQAVADDVSEETEIFTTVIADGENYRANPAQSQVTTTLSDADTSTDLPTVSLTPENVSVIEGETFAWNISLDQPAPSGGLALSLPIIENNDPEPGDVEYNIDGSSGIADFDFVLGEGVSESFSVTIAEGETEAVLVSQAISDEIEEADEIFTTAIAQGSGYLVDPEQNEVTTTILDSSTDSNTTTDTSISFELEDLLVPARDAVVDVAFDLDYVSGIENSEFLPVGEIADSIEDYLVNNPADGDFFEVITEDLGEFLVSDAGLGIGEVAESITVEIDIEPNSVIPFPFSVTSTVEIV